MELIQHRTIVAQSVYTVPYMINMETLFEFYVRTVVKETLQNSRFEVDPYSQKWCIQKGITCIDNTEKNVHLMQYCIPDLVIREQKSKRVVAVMDAKYKLHTASDRKDSLQLLSYVLLTGSSRCGFIFPGIDTELKTMKTTGKTFVCIKSPILTDLRYYELILGGLLELSVLDDILK